MNLMKNRFCYFYWGRIIDTINSTHKLIQFNFEHSFLYCRNRNDAHSLSVSLFLNLCSPSKSFDRATWCRSFLSESALLINMIADRMVFRFILQIENNSDVFVRVPSRTKKAIALPSYLTQEMHIAGDEKSIDVRCFVELQRSQHMHYYYAYFELLSIVTSVSLSLSTPFHLFARLFLLSWATSFFSMLNIKQ